MQVSAEIRLFWRNPAPEMIQAWFFDTSAHPCFPGGGLPRTDIYFADHNQTELSAKIRGGKPGVEVKGLVAVGATIQLDSYEIPVEIWSKWASEALARDPADGLRIHKARWLRTFDTTGETPVEIPLDPEEKRKNGAAIPGAGCNVEWTVIDTKHEPWWTLGLEAFGGLGDVSTSLHRVVDLLTARRPPAFPAGALAASYPKWLAAL
jgi:hypothetical protein